MANQYVGAAIPNTPATAKALITAYLDGETMQELAELHGVTRPRLYQILLGQAPEEWREAQVAHAVERLEQYKKELQSATDALMLARAREGARIAQWELERLLKRLYGPSQEVTGKDGGPLTIEIVTFASTQVEHGATQDAEVVTNKQLSTS